MRNTKFLITTLLASLFFTGGFVAMAGTNGPGPQSIKHPTKINLAGILGKSDDSANADSPASAENEADSHGSHEMVGGDDSTLYIAVIEATEGNDVSGTVFFEKVSNGILVTGRIEGLTPGDHGFHVHQYGDLSASDGTSAGGHFNPENQPHAGPKDEHRHVGDLGNITADENGVAEFAFVDKKLAFHGKNSILGRGLIVHRDADDLTSQPTGDAGPRVGMAVIGVANPDGERL